MCVCVGGVESRNDPDIKNGYNLKFDTKVPLILQPGPAHRDVDSAPSDTTVLTEKIFFTFT